MPHPKGMSIGTIFQSVQLDGGAHLIRDLHPAADSNISISAAGTAGLNKNPWY